MSRFALLLASLLLVTGCTSSSDDDGGSGSGSNGTAGGGASSGGTSSTPGTDDAPTGPDCADVWQEGKTLPDDYETCLTGGQEGPQEVTECQDGSRLVEFDVAYYAVTGGEIKKPNVAPMQDTDEFSAAYDDCVG
jgi:hypothetical protein